MKGISRLRLRLPFSLRKNGRFRHGFGSFREHFAVSSSDRRMISAIDSPVRAV